MGPRETYKHLSLKLACWLFKKHGYKLTASHRGWDTQYLFYIPEYEPVESLLSKRERHIIETVTKRLADTDEKRRKYLADRVKKAEEDRLKGIKECQT